MRNFHIPNPGNEKAPLRLIAVTSISLKAKNMKAIPLFLLAVAGLCPVLFSSCATTGSTSSITAPSAPGHSIATEAQYNPADLEFTPPWPFGPNTYR
jgi:hypothetical protein